MDEITFKKSVESLTEAVKKTFYEQGHIDHIIFLGTDAGLLPPIKADENLDVIISIWRAAASIRKVPVIAYYRVAEGYMSVVEGEAKDHKQIIAPSVDPNRKEVIIIEARLKTEDANCRYVAQFEIKRQLSDVHLENFRIVSDGCDYLGSQLDVAVFDEEIEMPITTNPFKHSYSKTGPSLN